MKNFLEFLSVAIPFFEPYPYWIKLLVVAWVVLSGAIVVSLFLFHPQRTDKTQADTASTVTQSASTVQGDIIQAGRDININNTFANTSTDKITALTVEARLTCVLKDGAELPPSEVTFLPVGDSDAYLIGSAGKVRLTFVSPVHFRFQEPDKIVVVNKFSLRDGIEIINRPLSVLKNYGSLSLPIVTIVYGGRLEKITLLELTMFINGETIWYGSWHYDVDFQQGPRFDIPLEQLHNKL